jgi:hypothetical protein
MRMELVNKHNKTLSNLLREFAQQFKSKKSCLTRQKVGMFDSDYALCEAASIEHKINGT